MFSTLRTRFGIPGVISVIALVFAMLGGAYAATNNSGAGKATASAKAKAGPAGPGPAGANGTNGAKGDAGPKGDTGAAGSPGSPGTAGAPGKSVKSFEIEPGEEECEGEGGTEFEVEGAGEPSVACNGKEGSPWTAGGTLPPPVQSRPAPGLPRAMKRRVHADLFPIPMINGVGPGHAFYGTGGEEGETEFKTHCPATNFSNPQVSNPGELCVYLNEFGIANATFGGISLLNPGIPGASRTGALLTFEMGAGGIAIGSWAIKGCSLIEGDPNKCP